MSILPENPGRVSDIDVTNYQHVTAGEPLFSIENASQAAAVDAASVRVEEVDAQFSVATADPEQTQGKIASARGALHQAQFDLKAVNDALKIDVTLVSQRQIER